MPYLTLVLRFAQAHKKPMGLTQTWKLAAVLVSTTFLYLVGMTERKQSMVILLPMPGATVSTLLNESPPVC